MKKLLLLLLNCTIILSANAQVLPAKNIGWCRVSNPDPPSAISSGITQIARNQVTTRLVNQNGVIIIPVVFHVLWNNSGQNISTSYIQSQITRLNTDFRKLNPDVLNTPAAWLGITADVNIEFRLACYDPSGFATDGIDRNFTGVNGFIDPDDAKSTLTGGVAAWPTDTYLNIWVCDLADITGALGWATFPSQYATQPQLDGIVLDYTIVGDNNPHPTKDKGRVAVHEVGHWLGLYHFFAGGIFCSIDVDFVPDTPTTDETGFWMECPSGTRFDVCNTVSPGAMYMNYMQYTNDPCMYMFTNGQKSRMRGFIDAPGPDSRYPFLQNYFSIKRFTSTPVTPVFNQMIVKMKNPACLPVTYTISGPVTEQSHDDQQIVLQPQPFICSGSVTVTATSGNYTDEYTFEFETTSAPARPVILNPQTDGIAIQEVNAGQSYTCTVTSVPGLNYIWTIEGYAPGIGGGVITAGQGTSEITFVPNECNAGKMQNNTIETATKGGSAACFVLITVRASNGPNCESLPAQIIFHYNSCGPVLPCCSSPGQTCCVDCMARTYNVYPNPASGSFTVECLSNKNTGIQNIEIIDITGNNKRSLKLPANMKKATVSTDKLPKGDYFIRIFDGQKWDVVKIKIL
jgi:hypothetical protein